MKKIYHPYTEWEDFKAGMYDLTSDKKMLKKAIIFTGNASLYGKWMIKVVDNWPVCCEQNLSDLLLSHNAWIGHAAACMAIKSPEEITRQAWAFLSENQQNEANAMAQKAIKYWHEKQNKKIYTEMGESRVLEWDSRFRTSKTRGYVQSSFLSDDM
jgi:hypothetical protein